MDRKYSVGHDRNAKKNDRRYFENTQESPHESNEHRISCLKANPYPKLHLGHSTISRTIILGVASLIGEKLVVEVGAEEAKVVVVVELKEVKKVQAKLVSSVAEEARRSPSRTDQESPPVTSAEPANRCPIFTRNFLSQFAPPLCLPVDDLEFSR